MGGRERSLHFSATHDNVPIFRRRRKRSLAMSSPTDTSRKKHDVLKLALRSAQARGAALWISKTARARSVFTLQRHLDSLALALRGSLRFPKQNGHVLYELFTLQWSLDSRAGLSKEVCLYAGADWLKLIRQSEVGVRGLESEVELSSQNKPARRQNFNWPNFHSAGSTG